jgi:hypothetical protein
MAEKIRRASIPGRAPNHSKSFQIMKTFFQFLTFLAGFTLCLAILPDVPTPVPYEPTGDPSQRVSEFIRGERSTIDDADLHSPNVPESLRKAALNLAK